jgi:hypothetical protein
VRGSEVRHFLPFPCRAVFPFQPMNERSEYSKPRPAGRGPTAQGGAQGGAPVYPPLAAAAKTDIPLPARLAPSGPFVVVGKGKIFF